MDDLVLGVFKGLYVVDLTQAITQSLELEGDMFDPDFRLPQYSTEPFRGELRAEAHRDQPSHLRNGTPVYGRPETLLRDGVAHVDAAYGGGDCTAFNCGRRDRDNDIIYLYGKIWHQPVDKVIDPIIGEARRLMCEPIKCENNADPDRSGGHGGGAGAAGDAVRAGKEGGAEDA